MVLSVMFFLPCLQHYMYHHSIRISRFLPLFFVIHYPRSPFLSLLLSPFRPDTNITLLFADTALASISGPSRPTPNRYACGVPSVKGGSQTFPEDCKDTKKQTKILLCA